VTNTNTGIEKTATCSVLTVPNVDQKEAQRKSPKCKIRRQNRVRNRSRLEHGVQTKDRDVHSVTVSVKRTESGARSNRRIRCIPRRVCVALREGVSERKKEKSWNHWIGRVSTEPRRRPVGNWESEHLIK